jgi:Major Facilitator Superfamily
MSLPRSLVRDLHAGPGSLELVIGGYAFAYAAGLITGGRLGDLFGYRRVLVPGTTGFGVMSLLCGLAASPRQLVAARMLQGLSGALMVPQVLALITATIPAGGSSALQTREQQVVDRTARNLAEIIADERHAWAHDMRPWVIANALVGLNRSMTRAIHQHALEGRSPRSIARSILRQGRNAFDMLEHGLDS